MAKPMKLGAWLDAALAESDYTMAELVLLAQGERQEQVITQERVTSESLPEVIAQAFEGIAQSEADAIIAPGVWAVRLTDGDATRRSPAHRAEPSQAIARGRYTHDHDGIIAMQQAHISELLQLFTRILPSVHLAQARHLDAQTAQISELMRQRLDQVAVAEKLASKEHERELEALQAEQRDRLQEEFIALAKDAVGRYRAEAPNVAAIVGSMTDDKRAKLLSTLSEVLEPDQLRALAPMLGVGQ